MRGEKEDNDTETATKSRLSRTKLVKSRLPSPQTLSLVQSLSLYTSAKVFGNGGRFFTRLILFARGSVVIFVVVSSFSSSSKVFGSRSGRRCRWLSYRRALRRLLPLLFFCPREFESHRRRQHEARTLVVSRVKWHHIALTPLYTESCSVLPYM